MPTRSFNINIESTVTTIGEIKAKVNASGRLITEIE